MPRTQSGSEVLTAAMTEAFNMDGLRSFPPGDVIARYRPSITGMRFDLERVESLRNYRILARHPDGRNVMREVEDVTNRVLEAIEREFTLEEPRAEAAIRYNNADITRGTVRTAPTRGFFNSPTIHDEVVSTPSVLNTLLDQIRQVYFRQNGSPATWTADQTDEIVFQVSELIYNLTNQ